ncbi:carbohydrate esterase family 4 protein [Tulasnella calospora MUT 4182]|uniref:Carbohydrate esterase family 4 protein n=1 Tax=Tulasnella calospora MUT 4182 TaxID=1051891 RepID=A0A0C3LA18_9AGAM|nr:carbohydrate esterase family 4 protein [Tulasnella calospora MUT 4182]
MLTTSRLFAFSLLATLASALPANFTERTPELGDLTEDEALSLVERATRTPVYSQCTTANTVAITFDDGPYIWNTDIVDTLNANNAKGTFFVNGNNYECIYSSENEQRLKTAYNAGHQIASHTWAHLDWTKLSKEKLMSEMTRVDTALTKILGVKPAFVRPPYGNYNTASREVAAENGQDIVIWDFDSGDSTGASVEESEKAYDNVANENPPTILTLNHETYETTAHQVLPYALNALKKKGYTFVTVAECLGGMNPYAETTTPEERDSTWRC